MARDLPKLVSKNQRMNLGFERAGTTPRSARGPGETVTVLALRARLDELHLLLRPAKEAKAFRSFAAYTDAVEQVASLCRQNEGWLRSVTGAETSAGTGGQNPDAPGRRPARRERAKLNHRAPASPGGPGQGDLLYRWAVRRGG